MLKHEQYEELAAAASLGEATGAELADLREHIGWCSACHDRYHEFVSLHGARHATRPESGELTPDLAASAIDSDLLRARFFKKAEAEGIVFSPAPAPVPAQPMVRRERLQWFRQLVPLAAALALSSALGLGGYYIGTRRAPSATANISGSDPRVVLPIQAGDSKAVILEKLEQENRALASEIASLKASAEADATKLAAAKAAASTSDADRLALAAQVKDREERMAALQGRLDQAQGQVASLRADFDKAQTTASTSQAQLIEDELRIRDLSAQLADKSNQLGRERDLLAAGRDVRELMSARNLHIVDVFDTDPRGKTRPAFGRIFFTEGKSLLFYAYDMPEARLQTAGYQYRIWGKKEGPNQRAHNLGIFFSDDKAQKRWVFQYDDPKVLNEIDSVFVTLEPPDANPAQPRGDKLMYAYLKGQPNHP